MAGVAMAGALLRTAELPLKKSRDKRRCGYGQTRRDRGNDGPGLLVHTGGSSSLLHSHGLVSTGDRRGDLQSTPTQLDLFFLGTLAPFFLASDNPIAMACFLLFTLPPFPPFPDRKVPLFLRCIALFTDLPAAFPYLAMDTSSFSYLTCAPGSGARCGPSSLSRAIR
jgi:hypothetical protein